MKIPVIVVFSFSLGAAVAFLQSHLDTNSSKQNQHTQINQKQYEALEQSYLNLQEKLIAIEQKLGKTQNYQPIPNHSPKSNKVVVAAKRLPNQKLTSNPELNSDEIKLLIKHEFEQFDWKNLTDKLAQDIKEQIDAEYDEYEEKESAPLIEINASDPISKKLKDLANAMETNGKYYSQSSLNDIVNDFDDLNYFSLKELLNESDWKRDRTKYFFLEVMRENFPVQSQEYLREHLQSNINLGDVKKLEESVDVFSSLFEKSDPYLNELINQMTEQLKYNKAIDPERSYGFSEILLESGNPKGIDYIAHLLNSQSTNSNVKEELMDIIDTYTEEDLPLDAKDAEKVVQWIENNKGILKWDEDSEEFLLPDDDVIEDTIIRRKPT